MLICSFDETIKMDPLSHFGLQMSTWASSRKLEKAKIIINAKSLQMPLKSSKSQKFVGCRCENHGFKKNGFQPFWLVWPLSCWAFACCLEYLKKKNHGSLPKTHYSKSQIFVQKFNLNKTLQFSREIKVVNN